jgi:dUTP pyrophosphatase
MSQEEVTVLIHRIAGNEDLPLPRYQTAQAVAMDLHAAVTESIRLSAGDILLVPCGFSLAVPTRFEAQIRPRSGLASNSGIAVVNSPGRIDSDDRGEVKVALINLSRTAFSIERGMRIAQLLIVPVPRVRREEVAELPDTARGEGGFGHTGERPVGSEPGSKDAARDDEGERGGKP